MALLVALQRCSGAAATADARTHLAQIVAQPGRLAHHQKPRRAERLLRRRIAQAHNSPRSQATPAASD